MPSHIIECRNDKDLVILDVEHANSYQVPLHLELPKGAKTGPAANKLYQLLLASVLERANELA